MEVKTSDICGKPCQRFSRINGYIRPVDQWGVGKKEEYKDRVEYTKLKK